MSDLNAARPVTAGGTGATSAQTAVAAFLNGTTYVLDSNMRIAASGDTTKLVDFDLSGITTATKRTLTVQDADGTIALTSDLATKQNAITTLHLIDEKTNGTAGGDFTSGAFRTRTLNTEVVNTISGASLSSNTITLPAGTYVVHGSAPANLVGRHRARLYSASGGVLIAGTNEIATATAANMTRSLINGVFTLATSRNDIVIDHYCQTTRNGDGFGDTNADTGTEVYAEILFMKVA